jgi:hypothetical protein
MTSYDTSNNIYVEVFKTDVIVFIGSKRDNVMSHCPISSTINQYIDTDNTTQ